MALVVEIAALLRSARFAPTALRGERAFAAVTSRSRGGRAFAAALLALTLAACPGGGSPRPHASRSPSASATASPRSGGTLVVAYPHEPATLNPFVRGGDAPATRDLIRPLLPSLYRLGPHGERTRSLLASEPVVSATTPFSVKLTLRADARWSDGAPITTRDLVFTWHALASARNVVVSRDGYDQLRDVTASSATEATLVFKSPYARWPDLFWAILPEHRLRTVPFARALATAYPVSGGPFVLRGWTRGLQLEYVRNPRAWEATPALDRIVVRFVPDVTTALQLLRRREVDALGPYDAIDFARRASLIAGVTTTTDTGATWAGLWLNTRVAELSDARVRRALAYTIDRAAIEAGLVRDGGEPLNTLTPSGDAFAVFRHDVSRARTLLDQAGWRGSGVRRRNGRSLLFTVATIGSDELPARVLRALHAQAQQAYFDLNVVDLDGAELWSNWLRTARMEAAFVIVRDPPLGSARARFESTRRGVSNVLGVADATLDRLLRAADAPPGDAAAAIRADQRLAEIIPVIPLYRVTVTLAASAAAGGMQANASADGFLWNAAAWFRRPA